MAEVPTTVNIPATLANKALKVAIDFATDSAKAALLVEAPWLGAPIVSQIFDYILGWLSGYFYRFIAMKATFAIINFQTQVERDKFLDSMAGFNNAVAIGASADDIAFARAKVVKDFDNFVHWNGSARP